MNVHLAVFLAAMMATIVLGKVPKVGMVNDEEIAAKCKRNPQWQLKDAVKNGLQIIGALSDTKLCYIDCLIVHSKNNKQKIELMSDDFDPCDGGQGCLNGKCVKNDDDAVAACKSLYNSDTIIGEPDYNWDLNCMAKCTIKGVNYLKTCGKPNYKEGTPCKTESASGYTCQSGVCSNKPLPTTTTTAAPSSTTASSK